MGLDHAARVCFPCVIDRLLRRATLHTRELITHRIPFERAPDAYQLLDEKPDDVLAIVLTY